MTRFEKTAGWQLVRPVEIQEPRPETEAGKKGYSLFLHPQPLHFDLDNVLARTGTRWLERHKKRAPVGDPPESAGHELRRYITASAKLPHDVTVFRLGAPPVSRWRSHEKSIGIEIFPLSESAWESVKSTDRMIGLELPDDGILAGEPGRFSYHAPREAYRGTYPAEPEAIYLTLYVAEEVFARVFEDLLSAERRISAVKLTAEIELFEHEVDGFFADQTPVMDYGLLAKDPLRGDAYTRARLSTFLVDAAVDLPRAIELNEGEQELKPKSAPIVEEPATAAARAIVSAQDRLAGTVRRCAIGLSVMISLAAILIAAN